MFYIRITISVSLGTIDLDIGEILDGVPVYIHAKIKWREGWFMGIQNAFIALDKDKEITGVTYQVLNYIFEKLGFENYKRNMRSLRP